MMFFSQLSKQERRSEVGFTLVELLVTTAVMGILVSLSVGFFNSYRVSAHNAATRVRASNVAVFLNAIIIDVESLDVDCRVFAAIGMDLNAQDKFVRVSGCGGLRDSLQTASEQFLSNYENKKNEIYVGIGVARERFSAGGQGPSYYTAGMFTYSCLGDLWINYGGIEGQAGMRETYNHPNLEEACGRED